MYCQHCGMHNTDDMKQCQVCGADTTGVEKPQDMKIFTDLTQFPYRALLDSFKSLNLIVVILLLPLFTLIYLFRKMTGKPLLSPILNSITSKLHITTIERAQRLHRKSFEKIISFLGQQGFEPLIDLEDVSLVQGNLQRLMINREQGTYATIRIEKSTGKVQYVIFSVFLPNNTYFSVDNTYAVAIDYPENIIVRHFPKQSVETTYQEFLRILATLPERPRLLEPQEFFPVSYALRRMTVQIGIDQGRLYMKGKETPSTSACYYHPVNPAVRLCSVCNTPLCEACYTAYQDRYYCANCLPDEAKIAALQPVLLEEEQYAGLGVRTLATLIDALIIGAFTVAVYFGLSRGVQMFTAGETPSAIPFLLTQFVFVVFTVFYLIFPLSRYGRTIGQKLLGLRVIDRHGKHPDIITAVVRFAYHLIAGLFLLPLLGYLFIPFRKTKQGLHDQLAGTYVVTTHPRKKAIVSWLILLSICGASGWYAYQCVMPRFPFFRSISSYDFTTEITLERQWISNFQEERMAMIAYALYGEQCIVSTSTALQALDIFTGEVLWTVDTLANARIQQFPKTTDAPLVVVKYQMDRSSSLVHLDPKTGSILWERPLETTDALFTLDSRSIVTYGESFVAEYDLNGTLLWENKGFTKRFRDNSVIEYVMLNEGILIGSYSETAQTLTYLAHQTGETIWEMPQSQYTPGYVIGKGYQCFYAKEGEAMLMYLPEQKMVWESPRQIGYVMAYDPSPLPDRETPAEQPGILYTTTSVVRGKDGSVIFSYPANTRFGCVTNDFLILLSSTRQGEMLLLDKLTGEVKRLYQEKSWFATVYLSEDESYIYLAANLKPSDPTAIKIVSELLCIDKRSFELREILIGKNIGPLQFKLFPQEKLIVIPTYQHIGGYKIPEV